MRRFRKCEFKLYIAWYSHRFLPILILNAEAKLLLILCSRFCWPTKVALPPQIVGFSVQQASTMDTSLGKFRIPPASLYAFFIVSIMSTLAIYDRLILPLLKKSRGSQGKWWTLATMMFLHSTYMNKISSTFKIRNFFMLLHYS